MSRIVAAAAVNIPVVEAAARCWSHTRDGIIETYVAYNRVTYTL
jgi:hypothetical protein